MRSVVLLSAIALTSLFGCAESGSPTSEGVFGGSGGGGEGSIFPSAGGAATGGTGNTGTGGEIGEGGGGVGGMGTAGAGGMGPVTNTMRVTIDHIQFIKNGDLIGKGDNNYEIEVTAGGQSLLLLAAQVKSSQGEVFNLDEVVEFDIDQEPAASFEVSFWANDTGTGANEYVTASATHDFDWDSGQWPGLTSGLTLTDEDGQLKVQVVYAAEVLQ